MKYLIVLLFINTSFACMNEMPLSEVVKSIDGVEGAGAVTCSEKSEEQCICFDGKVMEFQKLVNDGQGGKKLVLDLTKRSLRRQQRADARETKRVYVAGLLATGANLDCSEYVSDPMTNARRQCELIKEIAKRIFQRN